MSWNIILTIVGIWLIGFGVSFTMGGFIHILLVIALILMIIKIIRSITAKKEHYPV